jgi:hypothetical protein
MSWRVIAIGAYIASLMAAFAILNADYTDWVPALALVIVGGLILGRVTDFWTSAALVPLAPVLALPFGYAEEYLGSDAPQIWFAGLILTPILMAAIIAGVGLRKLRQARIRTR